MVYRRGSVNDGAALARRHAYEMEMRVVVKSIIMATCRM